jgi:hypothetical protein
MLKTSAAVLLAGLGASLLTISSNKDCTLRDVQCIEEQNREKFLEQKKFLEIQKQLNLHRHGIEIKPDQHPGLSPPSQIPNVRTDIK